MPILQISVLNKTPTFHRRSGVIVCCNDDYKVKFTFDSEWDGITDKVARFVFNGTFIDRPINSEGVAAVPVIHHAEICQVGVYSASNAAMRTTTSAAIECENSIRSLTDTPAPPSEDPSVVIGGPAIFLVTVTGNDTDGYTADKSFEAILSAESDGKVVQVELNGAVHHLTSKSGDDLRAFSRVSPNPYVEDGSIIETSIVDIRSSGTVFVSRYSFNSNGGDNDPMVFEVTITGDDTDGYTADKTFSEIMTAEAQGKVVLVRYDSFYCTLIYSTPSLRRYAVENRGESEGELVRDEFTLRPDRSSGAVVIAHNRMVFNTSVCVTDEERAAWNSKADGDHNHDGVYAQSADVPSELSQLAGDATHRTVTDAEKAAWNSKASGDHNHDGLYVEPSTLDILWADGDGGMSIRSIAEEVAADHNVSAQAHADIRLLIQELDARLTALADSDDTTLDQLSELVAYIKDNRELIEGVTSSKVNVSDIVDNLVTNVTNKPLSAAQGVALKALIDELARNKVDSASVATAIENALKAYPTTTAMQAAITSALSGYAKTADVPTKLSQLAGDASHRTVTDAEKSTWNGKAPADHSHDERYVQRDDLSAYWESHIADKIAAIKALQDAGGKDCFSFVAITDIHYSQNLGKRSPAIAKRIMDACGIKFALALGDYQSRGSWSSKASAVGELEDARAMLSPLAGRLLVQQGNHDGSWGDTLNGVTYPYNLTPSELYNRVHALTYAHVDAVTDESGTGYYVDDKARKVRYIMLNSQCNKYETEANGSAKFNNMRVFRFTQSQYDFLVNEALVVEDGWRVVVAAHVPISNAYGELFNGGQAQSAKGDHTLMRGLLTAYRNKKSFSDSWDGTAGGVVPYTNLANPSNADSSTTANLTNWKTAVRVNSSKAYAAVSATDKANQQITNPIELDTSGKYHLRGINVYDKTLASGDNYNRIIFTDAAGNIKHAVQTSSSAWSACYSVASYDSNVAIIDIAKTIAKLNESGGFDSSATHIRFGGYTTDKDSVVITLNENIDDNNVVTGYDAVNIDANFTGYKGELVGYFAGHAHGDNVYSYADWGIPIVTTRCDGASENVSSLLNERVAGTVTEQSFDVFTVNTATRKIYATKIGAGSDRIIDY